MNKIHEQNQAAEKREKLLEEIMENDIFSDTNKLWAVHCKTKKKFRSNKRYIFSCDVAFAAATRHKLYGNWTVYRSNETGTRSMKFHTKADKRGAVSVVIA